MTDLTKITTPFGLLDKETQDALREHGGPYEWFQGRKCGWQDEPDPEYAFEDGWLAIRVKPQPPKPREWWLCRDENDHPFSVWDNLPAEHVWSEVIHVREVLE